MKFKGKSIAPPEVVDFIIGRKPENLVFRCQAVLDYSEFEKLVPIPTAPLVSPVGKKPYHDVKDKKYLAALERRADLRTVWMCLKTIEKSEIEFETINMNDPDTWNNFETELRTVLTPYEFSAVLSRIYSVNVPSEKTQAFAENFSQVSNMSLPQTESLETLEQGTT